MTHEKTNKKLFKSKNQCWDFTTDPRIDGIGKTDPLIELKFLQIE